MKKAAAGDKDRDPGVGGRESGWRNGKGKIFPLSSGVYHMQARCYQGYGRRDDEPWLSGATWDNLVVGDGGKECNSWDSLSGEEGAVRGQTLAVERPD